MNFPQTNYTANVPATAFQGMIGDNTDRNVATGIAEVALDCGLGVVKGTSDNQVKLPTAAGDVSGHFQGFAIYNQAKMPTGTANRYAIGDAVPVLRRGTIWIKCEAATAKDDPVYIVNSGATAGQARSDANAGAATVVAGARFVTGASGAGELGLIEVNLP